MITVSQDIENACYSQCDKLFEDCHKKFIAGDRSALMEALIICSLYQKEIPGWVADELLTLDDKLATGELADMNEFFNYKPKHQAKRGKEKRNIQLKPKVISALFDHRLNGGNFTSDDGLDAVSKEIGVPRRVVEEVCKENKGWLKALPKKGKEITGYVRCNLPSLLEAAKLNRQMKRK